MSTYRTLSALCWTRYDHTEQCACRLQQRCAAICMHLIPLGLHVHHCFTCYCGELVHPTRLAAYFCMQYTLLLSLQADNAEHAHATSWSCSLLRLHKSSH